MKTGTLAFWHSKVKRLRHQKEAEAKIKQLKLRVAQKTRLSHRQSGMEPKVIAPHGKIRHPNVERGPKEFQVIQNVNRQKMGLSTYQLQKRDDRSPFKM